MIRLMTKRSALLKTLDFEVSNQQKEFFLVRLIFLPSTWCLELGSEAFSTFNKKLIPDFLVLVHVLTISNVGALW